MIQKEQFNIIAKAINTKIKENQTTERLWFASSKEQMAYDHWYGDAMELWNRSIAEIGKLIEEIEIYWLNK